MVNHRDIVREAEEQVGTNADMKYGFIKGCEWLLKLVVTNGVTTGCNCKFYEGQEVYVLKTSKKETIESVLGVKDLLYYKLSDGNFYCGSDLISTAELYRWFKEGKGITLSTSEYKLVDVWGTLDENGRKILENNFPVVFKRLVENYKSVKGI